MNKFILVFIILFSFNSTSGPQDTWDSFDLNSFTLNINWVQIALGSVACCGNFVTFIADYIYYKKVNNKVIRAQQEKIKKLEYEKCFLIEKKIMTAINILENIIKNNDIEENDKLLSILNVLEKIKNKGIKDENNID